MKRTVNGAPVSQEQIDMITAAVSMGLICSVPICCSISVAATEHRPLFSLISALVASASISRESVERFMIGNCPDKKLMGELFRERAYQPGVESDPDSAIGVWWH